MEDMDLELKLTRGSPIQVEKVGTLYPLNLHEVSEIGEIEYNKYISSILLKKESFGLEDEDITPFQLTYIFSFQDEAFRKIILKALSHFFKEEVHFNENGFYYLGEIEENRLIGTNEYDEIIKIIKKQNFINDNEKEKELFNPTSKKAKELVEKLKHFRQEVKKKNQENGLNLNDIIQIVASHSSNINIFNIWDLTIYQLYALYIRLMMKENFGLEYAKYLQGEDPKNLKLDHWASKLKK